MSMSTSAEQQPGAVRRKWSRLSLANQFAVVGGLVLLAGALAVGLWVARQIERGVVLNSANATALYVDSFISPLTRELETNDELSIGPIRALDEALRESPLGRRLVSVKIWREDGTVVYSDNYELIGRRFEPSARLKSAFEGNVEAEFDNLVGEESELEQETGLPLLEIYSPIRAPWSGRVIGVVEFYEDGTNLAQSIQVARRESWLVVALVMLAMSASLIGIVYRGSRTIDEQREKLKSQLDKVGRASEQNRILRKRVQKSSERVSEINENFLRRTSAELHDGPSQLLALASMKICDVGDIANTAARDRELLLIRGVLDEAMREIRNICNGLSLPEIRNLSVNETIGRAANVHANRTDSAIDISLLEQDIAAPMSVRICIYRFVQETLNNAWQHADASGQSICCKYDDRSRQLKIRVSDTGPGMEAPSYTENHHGIGLIGLRERAQSIGAELVIESVEGSGTTLELRVEISGEDND